MAKVIVKPLVALLFVSTCLGSWMLLHTSREPPQHADPVQLTALNQTLLPISDDDEPLRLPSLIDSDGAIFAPGRLQGPWSLLFFGFTSCPDVCPKTLQVLSAVARDPASGVPAGATQIVFVSVDPQRDTPARMHSYLDHFGGRMIGLTGDRASIERFSAAVGAGARASATAIDHSTSIFVVDPQGRLAGVLLRPSDPAGIVADLRRLHDSYEPARQVSLAR